MDNTTTTNNNNIMNITNENIKDDSTYNDINQDHINVRVAVRVRPFINKEKLDQCNECIQVFEDRLQIRIGTDRYFTYDYVYGPNAKQKDIWTCVIPLIDSFFDGYNATIFAYGQTGSGKTYTMGSGSNLNLSKDEYGIIPRVIYYIFDYLNNISNTIQHYKYELKIQFLEIYGEEIRDLLDHSSISSSNSHLNSNVLSSSLSYSSSSILNQSNHAYTTSNVLTNGSIFTCFNNNNNNNNNNTFINDVPKVVIRESENGQIQVVGAIEEIVFTPEDCIKLLELGTLRRTTGSTMMNTQSSRSHAIFTLSIEQKIPISIDLINTNNINESVEYTIKKSYFNFVDLAGSERQKKTLAEGKRLKEGIDINKGLLALGNVISALGDNNKKKGKIHIPYRDSKLTRMLQDSLGGNSKTLMLTCISPADSNYEETLNTLKYANRAKNIKNKPIINNNPSDNINDLKNKIKLLELEIYNMKNNIPISSKDNLSCHLISNPKLELKLKSVSESESISLSDVIINENNILKERVEIAESNVLKLTNDLNKLKLNIYNLNDIILHLQIERDFYRMNVEDNNNNNNNDNINETIDNYDNIDNIDTNSIKIKNKNDKINLITEYIQTINDLNEKNKILQKERDDALLYNDKIDINSFDSFENINNKELIQLTEKEISNEQHIIKELSLYNNINNNNNNNNDLHDTDNNNHNNDLINNKYKSNNNHLPLEEESNDINNHPNPTILDNLNDLHDNEMFEIFNNKQIQLDNTIQNLQENISLKEELIERLNKSQINYNKMKLYYERKMIQMEEDVKRAQEDRDKLLNDIHFLENQINNTNTNDNTTNNNIKMTSLIQQLKEKNELLIELKKKQKNINNYNIIKNKTEEKVKLLVNEVYIMKKQKIDLIKKIKLEKKKYINELMDRKKEINYLKNVSKKDKKEILKLGNQKNIQDKIMKRKIEEMIMLNRKLKLQQENYKIINNKYTINNHSSHSNINDKKKKKDDVFSNSEEKYNILRKECDELQEYKIKYNSEILNINNIKKRYEEKFEYFKEHIKWLERELAIHTSNHIIPFFNDNNNNNNNLENLYPNNDNNNNNLLVSNHINNEIELSDNIIYMNESNINNNNNNDNDNINNKQENSIFLRLSNPSNFTGIHKNKIKESSSKRELIKVKTEKIRSRRLKEKKIDDEKILNINKLHNKSINDKKLPNSSLFIPPPPVPIRLHGNSFKINNLSDPMTKVEDALSQLNKLAIFPDHLSSFHHPKKVNNNDNNNNNNKDKKTDLDANKKKLMIDKNNKDQNKYSSIYKNNIINNNVPNKTTSQSTEMDVYSRLAGHYTTSSNNKRYSGSPEHSPNIKSDKDNFIISNLNHSNINVPKTTYYLTSSNSKENIISNDISFDLLLNVSDELKE